jgi:glycosyltransferase involved in cell wall biosynthesis
MIRDLWLTGSPRLWDRLVRNPDVVSRVERWVIHRADCILVVVEESRDRLSALGVPEDRITIVSNTPPLDALGNEPLRSEMKEPGPLHLAYLGQLDAPSRGVGVLLDAAALCEQRGLPLRLSILGDGRDRARLEAQSRDLGFKDGTVEFHGRLPYRDALLALRSFDVGVIPHFVQDHTNTTIPNKIFEYMAAGLAVIASDARPLARIVRETGCGEVFRNQDCVSLAAAIQRLGITAVRRRCSERGQRAMAERYNWEQDALRLQSALEAVCASPIRAAS